MMIDEELRLEDKIAIKKMFRVKNTIASMIRQRGYHDPQKHIEEGDSFEEFQMKYRSNPNYFQQLVFFKKDDDSQRLFVTFELEKNRGQEPQKGKKALITDERVQSILQQLRRYQVNSVVIVVEGDPTQQHVVDKKARALIDEINSMANYSCQVLNFDELVFDITKHQLVSQHIPINEEEKKALLVRYGLTDSQLPRILLSDPVAKFLGLKHGNVVKIVRDSETAGKYITYRIAV